MELLFFCLFFGFLGGFFVLFCFCFFFFVFCGDWVYLLRFCRGFWWGRGFKIGLTTYLYLMICIGNHMISSAILDKSARVNFQRLTKLQFVVFEKFTSADLS